MAITSFDLFFDKNTTKSSCSKSSNLNTFSSMKIDYTTNTSLASSNVKHDKSKIDKYISPYICEDRVQRVSRVNEKRFQNKNNGFMSSFPLAINIYKANSDEFKSAKKCSKKVKKSVLTLPNETAPLPHSCTVSDMNDSEYFNDDKEELRPKMRKAIQNKRKSRLRSRPNNLHDKDVKYCSKLDIQMEKSFKDTGTKLAGDDNRNLKRTQKKPLRAKSDFNAHDVWSLLRRAEHFNFIPSPPLSQDSSLVSIKKNKRKKNKQRSNRNDSRFIETRTEEFAYITSFVGNPQNSCSLSSFDRITVIEKQNEIQTISNEIEKGEADKSTIPFLFHCDNGKTQNTSKSKKSKSKPSRIQINNSEKSNEHCSHNKLQRPIAIQRNDVTLKGRDKKHQSNEIDMQNNIESNKNSFIEINLNNEFNMTQSNQCNDLDNYCNLSEKSESSNEDIIEINIANKNIHEDESKQHITGITKVVFSKGQNVLSTKQSTVSKPDFLKKAHLSSSTPVNPINSKVNQSSIKLSEIKRKLNKLKFPLVILGKDQLSSTITVENYDPPQFAGLDDHIWPFMQNWYAIDGPNLVDDIISNVNYKYQSLNRNNETTNTRGINNSNIISSSSKVENKRNDLLSDRNDTSLKKPIPNEKPIHRIKNRMMQFIHKKTIPEHEIYNTKNFDQKPDRHIKVSSHRIDVGTNTINNLVLSKQHLMTKNDLHIFKNVPPLTTISINNNGKTKSKWASDFIENVIRKIRNGVYYCQEEKDKFKEYRKTTKDEGVQTEAEKSQIINYSVSNQTSTEENTVSENNDSDLPIPGFDNRFSDLEIETLNNFNQVAVKHCLANIIIQFDVALSFENNQVLQLKQPYTCTPITLIKNQPTVFKCKTSIINAILPAELCSILPRLMKKIMNHNLSLSTPVVDKVNSNLSTISEFSRLESDDLNGSLMPVQINQVAKINVVNDGQFSSKMISNNISRNLKIKYHKSFDLIDIRGILTTNINLLPVEHINHIHLCNYSPKPSMVDNIIQSPKKLPNTCRTLQLYQFSSKKLLHSSDNYSFMRIVETILGSRNIIFNLNISHKNILKVVFYKNPFMIAFGTTMNPDINVLNFTNTDINIHDLHSDKRNENEDNFVVTSHLNNFYPAKAKTDRNDYSHTSKPEKRKSVAEFCINNTRNKKRGFVKLYKKCKSMSSISGNRTSTNLNKITNLEEFCLALGSGKMLSAVLDGNAERKILSAIKEMKNWINDITARQALLVLLLANKKDTPNLVRYRPIILQGIAVNRITRISELDMEIEVIERENLNKFIQASDYQKPFDESSERLLKSLLVKRKKLNPSYLRVMARYVGLGLLKSSK
ncbi:putative uncharacterized protein DDB_G0291812 isoform X2 [Vanessa cardui]|uniref:putative uncharacterized protein DDB_G0291812 isoform X2 n=1 Tax=Vanessa cardui TaxID=171605 RepID=UPI001F145F9B|nr:putative uncharacterized protein DDB_G0291812 isoform X2 [Vanessa cardui]